MCVRLEGAVMASVSPSNGMREGGSLELALATVKVSHARVPLCNLVFVSVSNTASVHTDITNNRQQTV